MAEQIGASTARSAESNNPRITRELVYCLPEFRALEAKAEGILKQISADSGDIVDDTADVLPRWWVRP